MEWAVVTSHRIIFSLSPVVDHSIGILPPSASADAWHSDLIQRRFDQRAFVRRRRGEFDSVRHTLAVCHHHSIRTRSAFGLSELAPLFSRGERDVHKSFNQA